MDGSFDYNQSILVNQNKIIGRDHKTETVVENVGGDVSSLEVPSSPSCVSQTSSISSSGSSVPKLIEEISQVGCHVFPDESTTEARFALSMDTTEKPILLPSSLRCGKYSPHNKCRIINPLQQNHATERRVRGLWNPNCHCLFSGLHDDILLYIFSHLSMKDTVNAKMVCRRWRHCASHFHTWKHVDATEYISSAIEHQNPETTSKTLMKHLDRHASHIRKLRICDIQHKLLSDLALPSLMRLEELHLSGYAGLTDTHVHAMLLSCKINHGSKQNRNIPLKVLKLEQCPLLSNNTIRSVSLFCPQLQELSLRGCRKISCLKGLQNLFQKKNIRPEESSKISLDRLFAPPPTTTTTGIALAHWGTSHSQPASVNGLESLFSSQASNRPLSSSLLPPLMFPAANRTHEQGHLRKIDISNTRVTAQELLEALQVAGKNTMIEIEMVSANGSGETWTNSILEKLCRCIDVSVLETLDIGCSNIFKGSSQLTDAGLRKSLLGTNTPFQMASLQRLNLCGHASISASAVADLLTNAPNLLELDLGGCRLANSTLAGFEDLTTALLHFGNPVKNSEPKRRGLRRLSLWRCFSNRKQVLLKARLADEELIIEEANCRTLAKTLCCSPSSKTLVELDLDACYFFDTDAISQLLHHCTLLRDSKGLSIHGTKFSDNLCMQESPAA